ncbi:MAG: hypothetical protein U9N34_04765 [Candidatus Cloacimonadota bacterium]|nr:hypothetical protein [Candidatus Cloacimonadota bacterium]
MEEFKHFTLSSIENEKQTISDRFDRDTKVLSKEEKEEYFEWNSDDYFMIEDVFTQISVRSFIVILFSYIEDGMNILCNAEYSDKVRYQKKEGLDEFKVKYTDMQGKGIKRAKLYLEKIIGRNLNSDKQPWSEIETLRKIRNTIVHSDGDARDSLKNDGNFTRHLNAGRLKLNDHDKIIIESGYLDYILINAREFFIGIEI